MPSYTTSYGRDVLIEQRDPPGGLRAGQTAGWRVFVPPTPTATGARPIGSWHETEAAAQRWIDAKLAALDAAAPGSAAKLFS